MLDFIQNGQATGGLAERLMACNFDMGVQRPFIGADGRSYMTVNDREKPRTVLTGMPIYNGLVVNAPATLRKNEWIQFDTAVIKAARQRLRAWADLRSANTFGGFNGMGKTILEHQTVSDPGTASLDMDGLTETTRDRPHYGLEGIPLPIAHSDFHFSTREVMTSRNMGTPLDTVGAEFAARRVAEMIERLTIGTLASYSYGGRSIYGYTNFPDRITKTDVTAPTAPGWEPSDTVDDVLDMIESLNQAGFYGPFMLYHSTDWSKFMNADYSAAKGDKTLKERLMAIDEVSDIRRLDFLTNTFTLLLVQMTAEVAQAVNGMEITTLQWESHGGMKLNFKVMGIQVPRLRADFNGNTGICHGTTA